MVMVGWERWQGGGECVDGGGIPETTPRSTLLSILPFLAPPPPLLPPLFCLAIYPTLHFAPSFLPSPVIMYLALIVLFSILPPLLHSLYLACLVA